MAAPTVSINVPTGYFAGVKIALGGSSVRLSLVDGVSGATGDGSYEVVFTNNELSVFGAGTNGPALHVVKGPNPMPYDPRVLRLHRFLVVENVVSGHKDLRILGGVGSKNIQDESVGTLALADGAITDAKLAPGAGGSKTLAGDTDVSIAAPTNGQVLTYDSGLAKWKNAAGGGGGGGATPYDATILAETSLVNYWPMSDAAGSTAAADSKGTITLAVNGNCIFGSKQITLDQATSLLIGGPQSLSNYLTFPTGIIPATAAFSLECVINACAPPGNPVFFCADNAKNFDLYYDGNGNLTIQTNAGGTNTHIAVAVSSAIKHIVIVYDGAGTTKAYVNGAEVFSGGIHPVQTSVGRVGAWAAAGAITNNAYMGNIAKLAFYNAVLTAAKIAAHYANV